MSPIFHTLGVLAWPVALVALLAGFAGTAADAPEVLLRALDAAVVVGFVIGTLWLGSRVGTHERFHDDRTTAALVIATAILLVTAFTLPRSLYQWWRYDNEGPPPWGIELAMPLIPVLVVPLLMLVTWLAWSALSRLQRDPSLVDVLGAWLVGVGGWHLLLGGIVNRTDHTSEDILHHTQPVGLTAVWLGTMLLLLTDTWRRGRGAAVSSGPPGVVDPGPHED